MKIIVKAIDDIIRFYNELKDGGTATIFITQHTDYSMKPTMLLKFADAHRGEKNFIQWYEAKAVIDAVEIFKNLDTVLVGCDAGMCRSPAVACAMYRIAGEDEKADVILDTYRYLNHDVYEYIMEVYEDESC